MPKQDIFDLGQTKKPTPNPEEGHPFLHGRNFLHHNPSLRLQPTP